MIIFPELQIAKGRLVASVELPGELDDPVALARHCADQGAEFLHLVDRDESNETAQAIAMVADAFPGHIQLESPAEDADRVAKWFDAGVSRMALSSAQPNRVITLAREWPGGIAVAIEADSVENAVGYARHFSMSDVAALIITDPVRQGTVAGCDVDKLLEVLHRVDIPMVWRGGVRALGELRVMALQAHQGLEGVICGRALLEGPLDLPSALSMASRD